jgi:rhodanese-related sulfurtransferase
VLYSTQVAEGIKKMRSTQVNASRLLFITPVLIGISLMALTSCGSSDAGSAPVAATASHPAHGGGVRVEAPGGAYTNLKPVELKSLLDDKDFILVDVHTPHEGQLPGTDLRVPFDQVEQNIALFPEDKTAKIVLSCQTGSMSSEASKTLVRLGYTQVFNLEGGMKAWQSAGYELIPESK